MGTVIPFRHSTSINDREFHKAVGMSTDLLMQPPDPFEDDPELATCDDPTRWIGKALGLQLWAKQSEIANDFYEAEETAVKSCHASGKSLLAAGLVWHLTQTKDPVTVITTAPTARQVKRVLWRYVARLQAKARTRLAGKLLTTELKVSETVSAFGFTSNAGAAASAAGFHDQQIYIIVDEAGGVAREIYEAIDGLSTGNVHVLWISNPLEPVGPFRDLFSRRDVRSHTISAFNCPNLRDQGIGIEQIRDGSWEQLWDASKDIPGMVNAKWVARMYAKHGEDSVFWSTRVEGNFPELGDNKLIPLRLVIEAQRIQLPPSADDSSIIGVDVARFGHDETVIYLLRGKRARVIKRLRGQDTVAVAGAVAHAAKEAVNLEAIHVDDIGVGGGVTDILNSKGLPVVGVNAGAKAMEPDKYFNRRAEMWDHLRAALKDGQLDLSDDDTALAEQLVELEYTYTPDDRLKLEPKEQAKKRLGRSPDDADALALIYAPGQAVADYKYTGGLGRPLGLPKRCDLGGM